MKRLSGFISFVALLGALTGCVGGPDTGQEQGLLIDEVLPGYLVPASIWMQDSLAGCEGRLSDDEDVAVAWAEGEPSLGVVLDENGQAICVDTWEDIQLELDRVKGDPSPDPMRPLPIYQRPRSE
jgi:hypothetical protein